MKSDGRPGPSSAALTVVLRDLVLELLDAQDQILFEELRRVVAAEIAVGRSPCPADGMVVFGTTRAR